MMNQEMEMVENDKFIFLPDLKNKLEEAIHDSINFFKKKCPYCDRDLFAGSLRNTYHVDHYVPIRLGGQDVPWNILVVCQKCNGKKGKKLPEKFLDEQRKYVCDTYLESVKKKYVGQVQANLESYCQIKEYLLSRRNELKHASPNKHKEVVIKLYQLIGVVEEKTPMKMNYYEIDDQIIRGFDEWADRFFANGNNLNVRLRKDSVVDSLRDETGYKGSVNSFTRVLKAYSANKNWIFNPIDICTDKVDRRIRANNIEYLFIGSKS